MSGEGSVCLHSDWEGERDRQTQGLAPKRSVCLARSPNSLQVALRKDHIGTSSVVKVTRAALHTAGSREVGEWEAA